MLIPRHVTCIHGFKEAWQCLLLDSSEHRSQEEAGVALSLAVRAYSKEQQVPVPEWRERLVPSVNILRGILQAGTSGSSEAGHHGQWNGPQHAPHGHRKLV